MNSPLISVVMPTYNSEKYVAEAVESILNQTFADFEFLIINEFGSNDRTVEICESYHDSRIKIIQNEIRVGLADSLNKGFELSRGKYIARMDSDDISVPERFEKQVEFMEANPDIAVLGGARKFFGDFEIIHYNPETHKEIEAESVIMCAMTHSTIMLRKDIINEFYPVYDNKKLSEDLFAWRWLVKLVRFHNLRQILVSYRVFDESRTLTNYKAVIEEYLDFFYEMFDDLGVKYSGKELLINDKKLARSLFADKQKHHELSERLLNIKKLFTAAVDSNNKQKLYDVDFFKTAINKKWANIVNDVQTPDGPQMFEVLICNIIDEARDLTKGSEICLFGLGKFGKRLLPHFKAAFGDRLVCISDNDIDKWQKCFEGIVCVSPKDIPANCSVIVTAHYDKYNAIKEQLRDRFGENIYHFFEIR